MDAIVYTSNSGFTREYAQMLGKETNLPVFPLSGADAVKQGARIIYLGWLMAGSIMGLDKAEKRFSVSCAVGVGMSAEAGQLAELEKKYGTKDRKIFLLQGGFDIRKLRGAYRVMMKLMAATVGKKLAKKADRTAEEEDMLVLLRDGGSRVSPERLRPVADWARENP